MENNIFVNDAINDAINEYLEYKSSKKWNFLIYIIEVLTYIYNEADIINPFITKEQDVLVKNITKYGINGNLVYKFFDDVNNFYKKDLENISQKSSRKNYFFTYVQEDLIDFFIAKFKNNNLNTIELDNFQKLIFSNKSTSQFQRTFNNMMEINENEAIKYYESKKFELNNVLSFDSIHRNVLNSDLYDAFGIDKGNVDNLSSLDLETINNKILNYFKLSPIEPNLNDKIAKKLVELKKTTRLYNYGKINICLFLVIIILVIVVGFVVAYKMVGW